MANGARWRMTNNKQFVGKATAYTEGLTTTGAHLVVDAARIGAETMQHIIETSGTGWDGRLGPADGRVDSGKMLAAVEYDKRADIGVSRRTGRLSRSARFGWISTMEDYFAYQNEGFSNAMKMKPSDDGGPPGYTLPMNAYFPAKMAAREYFRAGLKRITKRSWGK